jgi:hypothetical protein
MLARNTLSEGRYFDSIFARVLDAAGTGVVQVGAADGLSERMK